MAEAEKKEGVENFLQEGEMKRAKKRTLHEKIIRKRQLKYLSKIWIML